MSHSRATRLSGSPLFLLTLVLAACGSPKSGSGVDEPVLTSLTLTPDSAILEPGASQGFTVSGQMSDGSSTAPSVTWSATGGSISLGGMYAAGSAMGTYRVIAAASALADTAIVRIAAVPGLTQLTVTPASASLGAGGTQQFSVSGQLSDGSSVVPAVTWAATGGSITAGGLFTAGAVAGSYRVIATQTGGPLADTAAVTVSAAPGGVVDTVWFASFEAGTASGWDDEGQPLNHAVVAPPGGAFAGTQALQVTYPQGADGGWLTHFFMPGFDSIYVRYYLKLEATWQGGTKLSSLYGSRTDNQWSATGKAGVCPTGTDFFQVTLTGDPTPPMWLRFYDQYVGMPSSGGTCFGSNGSAGTVMTPSQFQLTPGVWHKVEYWTKLNDPGQTNSVQEFRIDGVVRGTWSGISLRSTTILRLNAFTLTMSAPSGAPLTQHLWVDDILITRQRPVP